jgi:hypothetical protein
MGQLTAFRPPRRPARPARPPPKYEQVKAEVRRLDEIRGAVAL